MPPNTLRVRTEHVLVKSVGTKVLWAVAAETTNSGPDLTNSSGPSILFVKSWSKQNTKKAGAVGSLVVRASDSRLEGLGIFDAEDAPHTGRPVVEDVDKTTERIEIERHVSSRSIAQELKIDHKIVLNHLRKVGFKKKLDVWVPHQLTPKSVMDRIPSAKPWPNGMKSTHFLSEW
ncbi:histonelysine Nmethyltransferase SETMARlike [Trichonephila clavipes]|nr:histonelysine Nmethyltransferase SETMARlike [Trichonephila clavipes]